ncbi:PDZ domain-containing protein [Georgenia halophila]|uniref:endopeptidase La n=1 Tax=Georgenia halophila TaxID=620889 RepID=A0ABP8KUW0_9MICO
MREQESAAPVEFPGRDETAAPAERSSRRAVTLVISGGLLALALLVAMLVPLPYAVQRPGPTVDTLGEHDGEPLIHVDGAQTYATSGALMLTTVSVIGGPEYPVGAFDVLIGWLRSDQVVLPVEALFPDEATREQLDERSSQQMASSQTNATVSALEELGREVPMVLTVTGTAQGSGARGVVENGDVITSIEVPGKERTRVQAFSELVEVLRRTEPGTTVSLGVTRDGEQVELEVETSDPGHGSDQEGSVLGVFLEPDVEIPFEVDFDIDDIGGPSAGTMFALGIIDRLTEGEMTGGEQIAGTGTMDLAGQVGAIGGIEQKLVGARRDGAQWFLAPEGNCSDVVGHVPDGLRVVSVDTLSEARDAVQAIGAHEGDDLPTCAAEAS